jgi:stage II sporulation protein D
VKNSDMRLLRCARNDSEKIFTTAGRKAEVSSGKAIKKLQRCHCEERFCDAAISEKGLINSKTRLLRYARNDDMAIFQESKSGNCKKSGNLLLLLLPLVCILFLSLILSAAAFAEPKMRILLLDNKNFNLPPKDTKFTRVGNASGDVLMAGIKYSGNIEVWKGEKSLYIINELPLEDYIKGVVAAEVKSNWGAEALKAQAVVARTYAIYQKMNAGKDLPYHLTSTVLSQVYKGANLSPEISKAVDDTRNEALYYQGKPIVAFYHSTSGGMTEDAGEVFSESLPYIKPVKTNCELSPFFMWEKIIPAAEIEKALGIKGIKDIKIDSYTVSGRVKEFALFIEKELNPVDVPATEFRKKLGWERLPSTMITELSKSDDAFVFEGRGYGHGVGMCQWSALQMAKEGKTYREILMFFYPGTEIRKYEDR